MQDYNEFFYGPRGWPMWMPPPVPAAPARWQLVPVETAKPKEPEKLFAFGSEGPPWMPPPGFKWQLVEAKKEDKKKEEKKPEEKKEEKKKEKPPEIVLKVRMCCGKCEDKVKEEILDVDGVTEVKTDRQNCKVTVVGKADESQVLKKAKKLDRKAKVVEVKKGENAAKKVEEKKKEPDSKKKEEPNITWPNDPRNYYPFYHPYYHYPYPAPPPFQPDGPYRPSQAYPPHYYPETDYTYYNYPNNPRYLTHIRHS